MADRQSFFNQPVKNDLKTYDNTRNIPTGKGDYIANGYLLD